MKEFTALFLKDIKSEYRKRASLNGIFLYVVSTVFVAYLIFNQIEDLNTWLALFWIILIFASTNASIHSFRSESSSEFYYFYGLINPFQLILAKLSFNAILLLIIALFNYFLFSILLDNPVENKSLFLSVIILGSLGLSATLTLVSAIASKTNNNSTLTAILGFPILLPTILTSIKASLLCGLGFGWDEVGVYLISLSLLIVVIVALASVLFPYLWRS